MPHLPEGTAVEAVWQREFVCALRRQEGGSALVEFAASAILLFTLIFGVVECSRAVYTYHFVANVAEEAARYAIVRGASWSSPCASYSSTGCIASSSNVASFVQSQLPAGILKSNLSVSTTWPGINATGTTCSSSPANSSGCVVLIKVTYTFAFVSPLLPQRNLSLNSTSEMTVVQ